MVQDQDWLGWSQGRQDWSYQTRQIHGWVRTKPNTTPVPIFDPQPNSELIATAWLLVPLMICWQVTWWDGGLGTSTRVHMNVSTSTRNTFTVTPATQMERCFILWVLIALVQLRLVTVLHIILKNNWFVLSVQSSCLFSSEAYNNFTILADYNTHWFIWKSALLSLLFLI